MGMRAHDHKSFPLCRICHTYFHDGSGPFKGWVKEQRNRYQDEAIEYWRERYRLSNGPGG